MQTLEPSGPLTLCTHIQGKMWQRGTVDFCQSFLKLIYSHKVKVWLKIGLDWLKLKLDMKIEWSPTVLLRSAVKSSKKIYKEQFHELHLDPIEFILCASRLSRLLVQWRKDKLQLMKECSFISQNTMVFISSSLLQLHHCIRPLDLNQGIKFITTS